MHPLRGASSGVIWVCLHWRHGLVSVSIVFSGKWYELMYGV